MATVEIAIASNGIPPEKRESLFTSPGDMAVSDEGFDKKFIQDWTRPGTNFYDPLVRTFECSRKIQFLAMGGFFKKAEDLYRKCEDLYAWNSEIGESNGSMTKENVNKLCDKYFNVAKDALERCRTKALGKYQDDEV